MKKDEGLDDDCNIKNTLLAHLGAFTFSNKERIKKNFLKEIVGF